VLEARDRRRLRENLRKEKRIYATRPSACGWRDASPTTTASARDAIDADKKTMNALTRGRVGVSGRR
jgi:hypothetical protein